MDTVQLILTVAAALSGGGMAWQKAKSGLEENRRDVDAAHQQIQQLAKKIDEKFEHLDTRFARLDDRASDIYKLLISVVQQQKN